MGKLRLLWADGYLRHLVPMALVKQSGDLGDPKEFCLLVVRVQLADPKASMLDGRPPTV